jgi:CRP-like cAMP-binding protein
VRAGDGAATRGSDRAGQAARRTTSPLSAEEADAVRAYWPSIAPESVRALVAAATSIVVSPGPVYVEGEGPPKLAIVMAGTVAATWAVPDGRTMFAGIYGPGQLMGAATLAGGPTTVGIDALTPGRMIEWESTTFREIAAADPAFLQDLLARTVYAIRALNHLIKIRAFSGARARLASTLLRYEPLVFSARRPLLPRNQYSALAGVTPRMISRILRDLEAAGVVRRSGAEGLVLIDRARLEGEAAPLDVFSPPDPASPVAWAAPAPFAGADAEEGDV